MAKRFLQTLILLTTVSCGGKSTVPYDSSSDGGNPGIDGQVPEASDSAGQPSSVPTPDPKCDGCHMVNVSICVASPSDIFVSGYTSDSFKAFIRRFDGSQWTTLQTWEDFSIAELWGDSASGVWGIGPDTANPTAGSVGHFDLANAQWTDAHVPGTALWAAATDAIFAMSPDGVQRYDGSSWVDTGLASHDLVDIAGSAPNEVFVLGADSGLHRFDGATWTHTGGIEQELNALWIGSTSEVYAVGGGDQPDGTTGPGIIVRHDGTAWTTVQEATSDALRAVAGMPGGVVYAVGASRDEQGDAHAVVWRGNDDGWQRFLMEDTSAFLWDADCAPSGECYAVGTDNTVLALDEIQ